MEIVDENVPIFTRPLSLHNSIWILRTVMYPCAKTCAETSQGTKIINCVNSLGLGQKY